MDYAGCQLLAIQREHKQVIMYMERVHPNGYHEHIGVKSEQFLEDTKGLGKMLGTAEMVGIKKAVRNFLRSKAKNKVFY